ncbi:class I SAM-dependent methyltransferase [Marilutibacter spongiae]|uniref:Class I SAM-dependent methyltransferase n=1 Tax=Marilutibacter spongiae TaxID=2025720 RepID=A0A7W3Y4M7_9GAMM|nr:class I SAM-dependent methyltransferase [Lysobacter spongiae]MBB1059130.1 class I SAM-dependent methyltransferase [Lysobacter spongiae]
MVDRNPAVEAIVPATAGWEAGELEMPGRCIACAGSDLVGRYAGLDDRLGRIPGSWGFLECTACGALNLAPRPTLEAVGKAYPGDYVTHDDGAGVAARDDGDGPVWRSINGYLNMRFGANRKAASRLGGWCVGLLWPVRFQLDYFFRHLPPTPGRLLDVGCGNGAFLSRAADAGWTVEGIEPDPQAAAVARRTGFNVWEASLEDVSPTQPFDRITLSHVLEHLHEPGAALQRMRGWLKPGGEIWLAVPNPGGPGHRYFGRNWFSLDPPRHLCLPTSRQLLAMLADAGFDSARLVRRGRGARSSILPSARYRKERGDGDSPLVRPLVWLIDLLASIFPGASEEIVVIARRGDA